MGPPMYPCVSKKKHALGPIGSPGAGWGLLDSTHFVDDPLYLALSAYRVGAWPGADISTTILFMSTTQTHMVVPMHPVPLLILFVLIPVGQVNIITLITAHLMALLCHQIEQVDD